MMRLSRLACLATLALTSALLADPAPVPPPPAPAAQGGQPAQPAAGAAPTIAVIDPQIVLNSMMEMKSIKAQFQQKQTQQESDENAKKAEIAQLQDSRKNLKPGSRQFNDISEQIDQKTAELQAWETLTRLRDEREQKQTLLSLYKEIEDASASIAQRDGIDLVITTIDQDLPSVEGMTNEQLHLMLDERVVMYHSARVDITQKVLLQVNLNFAKLQAGGNGGPPAPPAQPQPDGGGAPGMPPLTH